MPYIGRHEYAIEEPDLINVVFDGDLRGEHVTQLYDLTEAHVRERGLKRVYVLQDFTKIGTVSEPVRRAMAHDPRASLLAAVGSFGARPHVRVLINLVVRVVRLFRGKAGTAMFFSSEAEARAWLQNEKRRLEAET
jgi:hypothetical protein